MNKFCKELIKSDLYRYRANISLKDFLTCFYRSPGFRFTTFYRLSKFHGKYSFIGFFSRMMFKRLEVRFGFQIPKTVDIGHGFLIMHFGNLIINSAAVIGNNCNIYPGVTIGATFRGKNKGVPVIGNNVWIGSNSIIVGNVTIADNVLVAPNSFVNQSVPANSVVFGNPAIIKPNLNATEGYILNFQKI